MSSFDAWRAARLASAILLISGAAAGRDDAVDEILRRSQQTVNHAAAIAGEGERGRGIGARQLVDLQLPGP